VKGLQVGLLALAVLLTLFGASRLLSDGSSVGGWLTFGGGAAWAAIMLDGWFRSRGGSA
jgi:hypothetical protein